MGENKIKPWNTKASSIPSDESMFIDYEDEAKTIPCSAKFKTLNLKEWMEKHRTFYGNANENVMWEEKQTLHQMKVRSGEGAQLVVKFYKNTGVVFAQSKDVEKWASHDIDIMKASDSDNTFVKQPANKADKKKSEKDKIKEDLKKSRIPGFVGMSKSPPETER